MWCGDGGIGHCVMKFRPGELVYIASEKVLSDYISMAAVFS
jgi:hypothetical protein